MTADAELADVKDSAILRIRHGSDLKTFDGGEVKQDTTRLSDPAVRISLSVGEKPVEGLGCEECGQEFTDLRFGRTTRRFCSPKCRYRARDRERYAADPEAQRARSRRYYAENREVVLEKAAGRRGVSRGAPRGECLECGEPMAGRRGKVVCSRRCRDTRYRRLHPEAYKAKQARKYARRREQAEG